MANQLSGLDTAFLCLDNSATPMNIGALAEFAPPTPVHPGRLVELIRERAQRIPRLRRRVRMSLVPFGTPRWVDDADFDVSAHVFSHHLHRPRDEAQLTTLVADLMAERLDPRGPLWQLHVITGLPGGRFALLPKLHHALADGAGAVLLGLALLDGGAGLARAEPEPRTVPLTERLRAATDWAEHGRALRGTADITGAVLRHARPAMPASPLLARTSGERVLARLRLDMHDIKRVRLRHGGTTNDVLLAVLAGALRDWLLTRGDEVDGLPVRALIPVNKRCRTRADGTAGNQLSGYLCDLPVGEPDPVRRLAAVRAAMDANKEGGPQRGPGALPVVADMLPAAVHRFATPVIGQCAPLLCDTVVTSVPLPGVPLAFDGADLREIYPVVPLAAGHALGVAFSSYRGTVHVGLHADARALPDISGLADALFGGLGFLNELCA